MPIKSYRGKLEDGEVLEINLRTQKGLIGYKVVKLQLLPFNLNAAGEAAVKVFKTKQSSAVFDFNFEDNDLLAAAYFTVHGSADVYPEDSHVIFDNEVVNQNIFITHKNNDDVPINFYLELEQIKLNDNEATYAPLQSLRSRYDSTTPAGPS